MEHINILLAQCLTINKKQFLKGQAEAFLIFDEQAAEGAQDWVNSSGSWSLQTAMDMPATELVELTRMQLCCEQHASNYRYTPIKRRPDSPWENWVTVGRSRNNDVQLTHGSVSKMHGYFMLECASGKWRLVDAGSSNGTCVNGKRLQTNAPQSLCSGDVVAFGQCTLIFYTAAELFGILRSMLDKQQ